MKRICRYLQGIKDNGLVFNLSKKLVVGFYADADFWGLRRYGNPKDPICVRSRTIFVVTFDNFPLFWVSKIQGEIDLSSLHHECVALSLSVRVSLTLKFIIKEVIDKSEIDIENLKFVSSSTVYEDNNGAIVVATSPIMTPTSKHIDVKYHWFLQHVGKEFVIWKIESENQEADIFTEGLRGEIFVSIRKLLYGW